MDRATQDMEMESGAGGGEPPGSRRGTGSAGKLTVEQRLPTFSPHCLRFQARRRDSSEQVEMRMLPEEASEEDRRTFLEELEDLVNLDHPAFYPVLDYGTTRGRPFYVAEFRQPEALWRQLRSTEFPLDVRALMARSLANAFAVAHDLELCLGPPSPVCVAWNPMLRQLGYVHHRTTPKVAPLPYSDGAPQKEVPRGSWTPASDVFHWAYFTYWLLTSGKLPFVGKGPGVPIRTHVPNLEREFAHVVDGCLMRQPALRPQNMSEVTSVLDTIERNSIPEGEELTEHSGTVPQEKIKRSIEKLKKDGRLRVPTRTKRIQLKIDDSELEVAGLPLSGRARQAIIGACVACVLLGIVGVGFFGWGSGDPEPPPRPTATRTPGPGPTRKAPRPTRAPRLAPGELGKVAAIQEVSPKAFSGIWRRLKGLQEKGLLPEELQAREKLERLTGSFWKDREKGCRELEGFLEELRVALRRQSK